MSLIHPSLALPPTLITGIPSSSAHTLSFLFTSSYVGCLYLTQAFFPLHRTRKKQRPPPSIDDGTVEPLEPIIASPSVSGDEEKRPERGSRDHPDTIRSRMKAVGLATAVSLMGVWWVVKDAEGCTGMTAVSSRELSRIMRLC